MGSITFNEIGTYNYDCSVGSHAAMGYGWFNYTSSPSQSTTVVDVVVNSENHTILEAAVVAAGLVETLRATDHLLFLLQQMLHLHY